MKSMMIKKAVARYYDISLDSKCRQRELVRPRQIAQYLCRKHTKLTTPQIAKIFNLDHTTILHNVETIGRILATTNCEIADEIIRQVNDILGILKKNEDNAK